MRRLLKAQAGRVCAVSIVFALFSYAFFRYSPSPREQGGAGTLPASSIQHSDVAYDSLAEETDSTSTADGSTQTSDQSAQRAAATGKPSLLVTCASDFHGLHLDDVPRFDLPKGDLLLYAGDIELRSPLDARGFEAWLASTPHTHKVVTFGNMDRGAQVAGSSEPVRLQGATVAVDEVVEAGGYRIFGSPWTPKFFGAFQLLDDAMARAHWAKVLPPDADVDIIITHGPPYGYADKSRGRSVGDKALLEAVQALKKPPLLWVTGHIHEGYGEHRVPHPKAPNGILLVGAANYYVTKAEHQQSAQPRLVSLPDAKVVGQGRAPARRSSRSN